MVITNVDANTKKCLQKIGIDLFIMILLEVTYLVTFYLVQPFHRGFFCDDESIMHPYHDSTVALSLGFVGLGLPIAVIVITEVLRWKLNANDKKSVKLFNRDLPSWCINVYKNFGIFLFGALVTLLITDAGKYSVGRLRPHFMDVCQPVMLDGTNCSDSRNFHRYVEDYKCTNSASSQSQIRDSKLSFPSGHASFSMYSMFFAALYLQFNMNWKGSKLLKLFLQCAFVSMAWFTALSRISDYKHHGSDVLCGSLLGVSMAFFIVFAASDLVKRRNSAKLRKAVLPINNNDNN